MRSNFGDHHVELKKLPALLVDPKLLEPDEVIP